MAARFAKSQVNMHTAIAANDQSVMGAHVAAPAGGGVSGSAAADGDGEVAEVQVARVVAARELSNAKALRRDT